MSDDGMRYSRPGGMSQHERAKTLARLGGGKQPNASGATQEAPPILASSEPSRDLSPTPKTPEEVAAEIEAVAAHNRANRDQAALANAEAAAMEAADAEVKATNTELAGAFDQPAVENTAEQQDLSDKALLG